MSNVFTSIQPVLFSAAQEVSQEPIGALQGVSMTFDDKGVAVGDSVKVPYAPVATVATFTPAAATPEGTGKTGSSVSVTIEESNKVSWNLTGEQQQSLANAQSDKEWLRQLILQGMRALRNRADVLCISDIQTGASRAYGTAATTPFSSDLTALTQIRKIQRAMGTPFTDMQLVLDGAAMTKLLDLAVVQNFYQAGTSDQLSTGIVAKKFGYNIREDGNIAPFTVGGTGMTINNGNVAAKSTSLTVDAVAGTIIPGDIFHLSTAATEEYVVNNAETQTNPIIQRPGLKTATSNDATATFKAAYTPNLAYERGAVVGIMRPPVMPANPTIQQTKISDSFGLTYLLCQIAQYGQVSWELHLACGFKVVQPEHVAILIG